MPSNLHLSQPAVHSAGHSAPSYTQASSTQSTYEPTAPEDYPPASAYSELPDDPEDSDHYSVSESDEGELSDTGDKQEVTEDMTYRETVRSVRSFMGWNHIPVFECRL